MKEIVEKSWDKNVSDSAYSRTSMTNFEVQEYIDKTKDEYEQLNASLRLTTEINVCQDLKRILSRYNGETIAFIIFQRPTGKGSIGHFIAMILRQNEKSKII